MDVQLLRSAVRCVDLIEDVSLATRVFRKGTRGIGDPCRLTVALNGEECLTFEEREAGDRAPAELVIDLRMPANPGKRALCALTGRPWAYPHSPVIVFVDESSGGDGIGYLVCSSTIEKVLETIRSELDLPDPNVEMTEEPFQHALDGTHGRR